MNTHTLGSSNGKDKKFPMRRRAHLCIVQAAGRPAMIAKRLIMLLSSIPFLAAATTWYASPDGADDAACTADAPGSLKRAITIAASATDKENGDVVQLARGTYWHTNAVIAVNAKYLTIQGATDDPADTIIRGIGSSKYMRAFNVNNYATFKGVTITNFAAPYTYMENCVIYSKTATAAGAVRMENCVIAGCSGESNNFSARPVCNGGEFRNCLFVANVGANREPIMGGSFFVATDCVFRNNRNGTLIAKCNQDNLSSAALTNCVFLSNTCRLLNCGGTLYRCAFTNNSTTTDGTVSAAYTLRLIDCDFHNNQANRGGATYGGNILAFNCTFTSNHCYDTAISYDYGGGCAYGGAYSNCVFRRNYISASNRSWFGGAIRGGRAMDCVFDGNRARYGGATYDTIATGCVFTNNTATAQGAATYRGAVTNCLVASHSYAGSDASGGITFEGRLTHCVLTGNTSTRNAFYNPIAVGCLISGNRVSSSGYAIAPNGTFVNCTLADNTTVNKAAVTGGTYTNTIVAATMGTADIGGGTHVHTLYGTKTGSPVLDAGSIQTDDPRFSGDSSEHPYSTRGRSRARDAGVTAFWTDADIDIAGKGRLNGPVDIGCYEFWPLLAPTIFLIR